jgi:uncharacterized phage infection (PIP) family protein YhgE
MSDLIGDARQTADRLDDALDRIEKALQASDLARDYDDEDEALEQVRAGLRSLADQAERQQEAAKDYIDAAVWAMECEKAVGRREVVRGLTEAREGHLSALAKLQAALSGDAGAQTS